MIASLVHAILSFGAVWRDRVDQRLPSGWRRSTPAAGWRKRVCFLRLFPETFWVPRNALGLLLSLVLSSAYPPLPLLRSPGPSHDPREGHS